MKQRSEAIGANMWRERAEVQGGKCQFEGTTWRSKENRRDDEKQTQGERPIVWNIRVWDYFIWKRVRWKEQVV